MTNLEISANFVTASAVFLTRLLVGGAYALMLYLFTDEYAPALGFLSEVLLRRSF